MNLFTIIDRVRRRESVVTASLDELLRAKAIMKHDEVISAKLQEYIARAISQDWDFKVEP